MSKGGLLVDTGFFIALYSKRDPYHSKACEKQDWLDMFPIVLPWPVLYETMNTRHSRRRDVMARFDAIVTRSNTELLDDTTYRYGSYQAVRQSSQRGCPLSLVDAVLRAIIEDTNVLISAMLTFDLEDFAAVCRQNSVDLL